MLKRTLPKSYPLFKYRLYKKGKMIHWYSSLLKTRFLARLVRSLLVERPDKIYLKIIYSKDNINEGFYTNKKDLLFAWRAFSEKSLINLLNDRGVKSVGVVNPRVSS
jgi:hypothetical protein